MSEDIEIGWIERDLRALDVASGEILVGAIHDDERPPGGVAAILDWRMCGRIAEQCTSKFLSGARGERFLIPGRPRINFDKVLFIGMGPRAATTEDSVRDALVTMIDALGGLLARRAAIDLPGRRVVPAQRALELLNEVLDARPSSLETVSVIDDREMHRAIEAYRARPRRKPGRG
jgi:hypothetical protein